MRFETLDITAPGLIDEPWNEAAVLGSVTWLWMHSKAHRDAPLHSLPTLLLPALKHRQFVLGSEDGKPVCYLSWLTVDEAAERRYLQQSPLMLKEADWNSGERIWLNDWVAPFGHSAALSRVLHRQLFANKCGRALYHRGEERGLRIKTFQGIGVIPEQARAWFAAHPVATTPSTDPL
ncbi:toxin-activating lysine-acyltransferase [Pseudomonas cannabina]|uniref:RTX toxin-activating lysine-acyltransferase n=2 Tax=Pseudomonas cannabina TaxID=86840 RepID=A0A0N8R018_PSECA|nr:toxin-activating lysine-acyltransferase [Pseudomonas cannabina]KAA8700312.1 toxin-activating lysine-acyltransferase [Pseudomonas cannabina]KPW79950.1 putative hemolysin activating-like protein [Pseudomonas cannabina]SDR42410.1 cytolysin-activating lysine-acyltransferase [Pseudomonas cannabina]